jgi:hypothetical protein
MQDRAEDDAMFFHGNAHNQAPNDEWDEPMSGTSKDTGITSVTSDAISDESTDSSVDAYEEIHRAIDEEDFELVAVAVAAHSSSSSSSSSGGIIFGNRSGPPSAHDSPASTSTNEDAPDLLNGALRERGSSSSYLPTLPPPLTGEEEDNSDETVVDDDDDDAERTLGNGLDAEDNDSEWETCSDEEIVMDETTILVPHPTLANVFRPAKHQNSLLMPANDSRREESSCEPEEVQGPRRRALTQSMRRRMTKIPGDSSDPEAAKYPSSGFARKVTKGVRRRLLDEGLGRGGPKAKFVKYEDSRNIIRCVRRAPLVDYGLSKTRYVDVFGKLTINLFFNIFLLSSRQQPDPTYPCKSCRVFYEQAGESEAAPYKK